MALSWKPRRYGKRRRYYCAPACGRDCLWLEYTVAKKRAEALVKELDQIEDTGPWKPRLHENLGWYFCAVSLDGRWVVTRRSSGTGRGFTYTASLGDGRWVQSAGTPAAAIKRTRKIAYADIQEYIKYLGA